MNIGERHFVLQSEFSAERCLKSEVLVVPDALYRLIELGVLNGVRKESRHILVTDKNIKKLHLKPVLENIERAGYLVRTLVVPPAETSKSFTIYAKLVEKALDFGIDKYSVVFSLGGGVVNNLAGFLASTLYRGIGLIHFPTSLLSQVDAAIDFKQAINFEHGKNLVGSYYPAEKIVIDPLVLRTLNKRLIRNGLAESIKHAFCQDGAFLTFVGSCSDQLTDPDFLNEVVKTSIRLKLAVMANLESEHDEMLKQYGHLIGHSIEHLSGGNIYHGEAIAIGMCVSAEIARVLRLTDTETVDHHYDIFNRIGLPTIVPEEYSLSNIWEKIRYDKHFFSKRAHMGLIKEVGTMAQTDKGGFSHAVSKEIVFQAIKSNRHYGRRRSFDL